ncbi:hypothetical protein PQE34_004364 [Klebsiella aerogenes]|nr:hypothetical protein [Klebsiella aerogenes]
MKKIQLILAFAAVFHGIKTASWRICARTPKTMKMQNFAGNCLEQAA